MKKVFKSIFTFPISPRKQFRRLAVVTFIALIGVIAFHIQFFTQIQNQSLFQVTTAPAATIQTVNEKKLTMVLSRYQDKSTTRDAALNLVPLVSNPSQ